MQVETPPTAKPYEKPAGERRGIVIVNTGDGKGKSTAAFGLALRAHGRGKAVKIFQFMKVPTARFGEHRAFEQLEAFRPAPGRHLKAMRLIFVNRFYWPEENATSQLLVDLAEALAALGHTVTEMTKVKHAFEAGVPAQRGIED